MASVRLGAELEEKVRRVAALEGLTISEVHRRALNEYLEREMPKKKTSRYDDIIGIAEGPHDLSARASEIFGEIIAGPMP